MTDNPFGAIGMSILLLLGFMIHGCESCVEKVSNVSNQIQVEYEN